MLCAVNFRTMKKYRITIRTYFGSFDIDDIEAENEDEAFEKACEEAAKEIENFAKLDEVYEIKSEFKTTDKKLYDHLINTKRIKK